MYYIIRFIVNEKFISMLANNKYTTISNLIENTLK